MFYYKHYFLYLSTEKERTSSVNDLFMIYEHKTPISFSCDTFEQLIPLQSPQAATQLRLFVRQEHKPDPHGFVNDILQL